MSFIYLTATETKSKFWLNSDRIVIVDDGENNGSIILVDGGKGSMPIQVAESPASVVASIRSAA